MKLIKSISVLAFLLTTTLSCAQWGNGKKIKGNGDITEITRNTGDYDGLKAAGSMDFKLVSGKEGVVTISGDSNLMEYIVTEIKNGNLIVRVEKGINLRPSQKVIVTVPYESIDNISLAGSGNISNNGTIKSKTLDLSLAGSGDVMLNVETDILKSSIAGSGDIELKGKTEKLKTKIAGSGNFKGFNLSANDVEASVTGSGNVNVVCDGNLKGRVTGSGDIKYEGNPKNKDTKTTGSGKIRSN